MIILNRYCLKLSYLLKYQYYVGPAVAETLKETECVIPCHSLQTSFDGEARHRRWYAESSAGPPTGPQPHSERLSRDGRDR